MKRNSSVIWLAAVAVTSVFLAQPVHAQASFRGLGDLSSGTYSSAAYSISADGSTVVGNSNSANGQEAFRWRAGVMTALGDLSGGGFNSYASDVSGDGSVIVGGGRSTMLNEAFRWENGTMTPLGALPGYNNSRALLISRDGLVIAGNSADGDFCCYTAIRACKWTAQSIVELPDLPGGPIDSAVQQNGISPNGMIIVGRGRTSTSQAYEACRWDNGVVTGLGDLPGGAILSGAFGVAGASDVIVGYSSSSLSVSGFDKGEACRWVSGVISSLGAHPVSGSRDSIAFSVSDDGDTVVGYYVSGGANKAFIWTSAQGMRDLKGALTSEFSLNLTGWSLTLAIDVSADGKRIVGQGTNPNGQTEGWIVRLSCSADVNSAAGNGVIDIDDLVVVITHWGEAGGPADVNGDNVVNIDDLVAVITAWGPCP